MTRWFSLRTSNGCGSRAVYHDVCMNLRHVRGQLEDLTKYVQSEADDNARFRVEYRLGWLNEHSTP